MHVRSLVFYSLLVDIPVVSPTERNEKYLNSVIFFPVVYKMFQIEIIIMKYVKKRLVTLLNIRIHIRGNCSKNSSRLLSIETQVCILLFCSVMRSPDYFLFKSKRRVLQFFHFTKIHKISQKICSMAKKQQPKCEVC